MRKKKVWKPQQIKLKYPKWSYVYNIDNKKYYLILSKTKKEFISERAFSSWKMRAVQVTTESIANYSTFGKLGFRPGTVVKSMKNSYYYIDEEKHLITTPDFFLVMGFTTEDVITISDEELNFHQEGENIDGIYL